MDCGEHLGIGIDSTVLIPKGYKIQAISRGGWSDKVIPMMCDNRQLWDERQCAERFRQGHGIHSKCRLSLRESSVRVLSRSEKATIKIRTMLSL